VQNWGNATFAAFNAITASYAILAYIGVGASLVDIWLGITAWLWVPIDPKAKRETHLDPELNWRAVLHQGDADPTVNTERRIDKEKELAASEAS
jgi:cellulose synthase (UDP-forming)